MFAGRKVSLNNTYTGESCSNSAVYNKHRTLTALSRRLFGLVEGSRDTSVLDVKCIAVGQFSQLRRGELQTGLCAKFRRFTESSSDVVTYANRILRSRVLHNYLSALHTSVVLRRY